MSNFDNELVKKLQSRAPAKSSHVGIIEVRLKIFVEISGAKHLPRN